MITPAGFHRQRTSNAATAPRKSLEQSHASKPAAKKAKKIDVQPPQKTARTSGPDAKPGEQLEQTVGDGTAEPGLQDRLLSLPVEIFAEICSFLSVIELRNLSLVDKTFWSVFVSPKSVSIWRQAFGRVNPPMPECPDTMSGPSYTRFMLVEACMGCQSRVWSMFDYFHRVRYCERCYRLNVISENGARRLYPNVPPELLPYLSSDAVSTNGKSLVEFRPQWEGSRRKYLPTTVAEVDKLWTALSESENISDMTHDRFKERLGRFASGRIESGLKMKDWQVAFSGWRESERFRGRRERHASILAKLIELGYEECDFPGYNNEVNKSVALTDEEWERIRPIVESAAASTRDWRRRNQRMKDLKGMWSEVITVASGAESASWMEEIASDGFDDFLSLPSAVNLLSEDTDGISPIDLDSIRPEALQLAIDGRWGKLTAPHNILRGLPVDHVDGEWPSLSDQEAVTKLDAIAAELALGINGFWHSRWNIVVWYPSSDLLDDDLSQLFPVDSLAPGLVAKLLESLSLAVDIEADAVVSQELDQTPVYYRCERCVESVAPYLSFPEIISHFLEKRVWFDKASLAREKVLAESSPSRETQRSAAFVNDHEWNTEGKLIASDSPDEKARVATLQHQFEAAYWNDPEYYEGEDSRSERSAEQAPQRRTRRICRLCPDGFSPEAMYFSALKIHIETIHGKVANVEEDTAVFDRDRDLPPANPCSFEFPYVGGS